jgi:hypothetical protein
MTMEAIMYEFRVFKDVGRRASRTPQVTITKGGMLNLGRAFMETFSKKGKYVTFHWDEKAGVIGLLFSNEEKPHSYPVKVSRNGKLGVITGIAFLSSIGLKHERTRSYEATLDKESGMVVIGPKRKV